MSGTSSYLFSAAAAAVACALLLASRRKGDITRRSIVASAVCVVWALVLAGQTMVGGEVAWVTLIMEALRFGAWLAVLRALTRGSHRWLKIGSSTLAVAVIAYAALGWVGDATRQFSLHQIDVLQIAGLVLAFVGLVATEQTVRNAPAEVSRETRLCASGVGGQFAFDLFLYSQALLLGYIDAGAWAMRGLVAGLLFVPIVVGARRLPDSGARVFVSRHVVFYTTTFVAVGLYLCVMALGGYHVRAQGSGWGNALQVAFLFGAGGILALVLVAESPLRRLRVFINTHFYRNKYDYRVEWIRFVQTLAMRDEADVRRTAIRAVAQIIGSGGGFLLLRDEDSDRYVARAAWPQELGAASDSGALPADDPLPRFLRERQWVIDLRELRREPAKYGSLQLPRWLESEAPWRVVMPLLLGNELLGMLVLRAPPEPFSMNFEDHDLLKTVGRNLAVQLAQHSADEKLALNRQFAAYNRFAAFVMHDLKNSVAQLQLLVDNAARHRNNPVFVDDAIGTIQNTAERMTRLIEQLQSRDTQGAKRQVDIGAVAREAVKRSAARRPEVLAHWPDTALAVEADPERLGAVIEHVIRNAQEATGPEGRVELHLEARGDVAHLRVVDDGPGMDPEFVRDRLFRPFDSTKGSKGMGIGAYQTRELARSLGGDVEVQSMPGRGTDFCIRLPLCQKNARNS